MGVLILFGFGAALVIAVGTLSVLYYITHPTRVTYGVAIARGLPPSPLDLGMTFAEHRFRHADGNVSAAWLVRGGRADGPVVLLAHGWGESRFSVQHLALTFAPHVSCVVLFDLRGHGESPVSTTRLGTREVADMLELVQSLAPPGCRVVLAGREMGAGIAIAAAAKGGSVIAGVIAVAPYRHMMDHVRANLREHGHDIRFFDPFVGAHLAFWFEGKSSFDRATSASRLEVPLLLVHGADRADDSITSPRATRVFVSPDTRDDKALSSSPEVAAAVAAFFRDVQA